MVRISMGSRGLCAPSNVRRASRRSRRLCFLTPLGLPLSSSSPLPFPASAQHPPAEAEVLSLHITQGGVGRAMGKLTAWARVGLARGARASATFGFWNTVCTLPIWLLFALMYLNRFSTRYSLAALLFLFYVALALPSSPPYRTRNSSAPKRRYL